MTRPIATGDTILYVNGGMMFKVLDINDLGIHLLEDLDTGEEIEVPLHEIEDGYNVNT